MYRLLDFGGGRKLESINGYIVDRPCPAADSLGVGRPQLWSQAQGRFEIQRDHHGCWSFRQPPPDPWKFRYWFGELRLRPTSFGHLGFFPEQIQTWDWIRTLETSATPWTALNLFASTGGTTLALAKLGAAVVHVDAARNTVNRARQNAKDSGLDDAPIRWIVDDVIKFVSREVRRGRQYDAVVFDPPSFGRGPGKSTWRIDNDLPQLFDLLRKVCANCQLLIFTCHSPGYDDVNMKQVVTQKFTELTDEGVEAGPLQLKTSGGRSLPSGFFVRGATGSHR